MGGLMGGGGVPKTPKATVQPTVSYDKTTPQAAAAGKDRSLGQRYLQARRATPTGLGTGIGQRTTLG